MHQLDPAIVSVLVRSFGCVLPEILLIVAACVVFLGGTVLANRHVWAGVALVVLAAAGVALWLSPLSAAATEEAAEGVLTVSPVVLDRLAVLVKGIALVGGALLVLVSWHQADDRVAADYHACLLIIVAGTCLVGSANELVTLFLALELISIPTYVLLYVLRNDTRAQEAAIKYFLLSIFSSALLLFGFSYLYGITGTTNLPALVDTLIRAENPGPGEQSALPAVALIPLVMVVAGLGFRITVVPFHFYAPDVFQGTPTPAAALLAFIPKVAGFVALLFVLGLVQHEVLTESGKAVTLEAAFRASRPTTARLELLALGGQVPIFLWILAAATMTLGNVLALLQENLKRLLAYSSVAHAGYMLMALVAVPYLRAAGDPVGGGAEALLFYLVAYGAMTIGAFAVIVYLSTPDRAVETVDDLAGLSRSHPGVALLMALFMFSLIGIPLTAGFSGKLMIFWGTLAVPAKFPDAEHNRLFPWLALIGAINAAIGAVYYLRIIAAMYLRTPLKPAERTRAWPCLAAVVACALITVAFGVYPWPLLKANRAALPAARQATEAPRGEPPVEGAAD